MRLTGIEGVDFVSCRSCGQRLRVISQRHLSKHDTDRSGYMAEYGLSPDQLIAKDFRVIQSSRPGYRPYDRKTWIKAVKKLNSEGRGVGAGDLRQHRNGNLYNLGVWLFGDWNTALRAAGFDPEEMRLRNFWDKERVIQGLLNLRKQRLPMNPHYVMKQQPDLIKGALRQCGSWNKALSTAGIKSIPRQTRLGLLRTLRDLVEGGRTIPASMRFGLEYYFGSVDTATLMLKTDKRLLSGWNKEKIIAAIGQKHRLNETLNYAVGRREFPALVSAAEAYFGSWGRALHTAGIDPNLHFVHHTWRKTKRDGRQIRSDNGRRIKIQ